jgi:formylglycine-generating enzyme required for sulfatase activity
MQNDTTMNSNVYLFAFLFFFSLSTFSQVTEPEMIFVKGGDFEMGCVNQSMENCASDEKTIVSVSLYDFSIGKYEVTNAQFAEFLSAEGNQLEGGKSWYRMDKYALIQETSTGFQVKQGFENFPVNNIS